MQQFLIDCRKTDTEVITPGLISTDTINSMKQSAFKAKTWRWRQARENKCEQGTIGFGFASHWLRNCVSFVNQSQSIVKQNQSKPIIVILISFQNAAINGFIRKQKKSGVFPAFWYVGFLMLNSFFPTMIYDSILGNPRGENLLRCRLQAVLTAPIIPTPSPPPYPSRLRM